MPLRFCFFAARAGPSKNDITTSTAGPARRDLGSEGGRGGTGRAVARRRVRGLFISYIVRYVIFIRRRAKLTRGKNVTRPCRGVVYGTRGCASFAPRGFCSVGIPSVAWRMGCNSSAFFSLSAGTRAIFILTVTA